MAAISAVGRRRDPRVLEALETSVLSSTSSPEERVAAMTAALAVAADIPSSFVRLASDPDADFRIRLAVAAELSTKKRTAELPAAGKPNGDPLFDAFTASLIAFERHEKPAPFSVPPRNEARIAALVSSLGSENDDLRRAAGDTLIALGEPSYEPLVAALADPDARLRESARNQLDRLRPGWLKTLGAEEIAALSVAMDTRDLRLGSDVVRLLGAIESPRAVPPLIETLRHPLPEMRASAAFALGKLDDRRAVEPLAIALHDEDSYVVHAAQGALRTLRAVDTVPQIIAALPRGQPRDTAETLNALDPNWRASAAAMEARQRWMSELRDGEERSRVAALEALHQLRDPALLPQFIGALDDASERVQKLSARAIATLARAMKETPDGRASFSSALGAAVPRLIELLSGSSPSWMEAADPLGEIGDPRAVEPLIQRLGPDQNPAPVIEALGKLKDRRALDPLRAALQRGGSENVIQNAIRSIEQEP